MREAQHSRGRRLTVVGKGNDMTEGIKRERLEEAARGLAILARQSDQYRADAEFRDAVDEVMALTRPVVERAVDEILTHLDPAEKARAEGAAAARSVFGRVADMLRRAKNERA